MRTITDGEREILEELNQPETALDCHICGRDASGGSIDWVALEVDGFCGFLQEAVCEACQANRERVTS